MCIRDRLLIEHQAADQFGIVPDEDRLRERYDNLILSFDSEDEALEFIRKQGMDINRLKALWEREEIEIRLWDKVENMLGVEPGSEEADQAYSSWLQERLLESQFEFIDPELESLFDHYMNIDAWSEDDIIGDSGNEPVENQVF